MSSDQIVTTEAREEGYYWVVLDQNPPEIAYWERAEMVALGRCPAVAAGSGDGGERAAGVQAQAGAGGVNEAEKLARAVLLFYRATPWQSQHHAAWRELSGHNQMTRRR